MSGTRISRVSRRDFLSITAAGTAGVLILGVHVGGRQRTLAETAAGGATTFAPNIWLDINADGDTTIWLVKAEMGQGVYTSLPMVIAEELDADWSRVRVAQAVFDPRYVPFVGTGGSSSVSHSWEPLRRAGATAREMLILAAANTWNVSPTECRTEPGLVIHDRTGRRAPYGTLVDAASRLPVPAEPELKDRSKFRLIGTRTPRLDSAMKVNGSGVFGIDVRPSTGRLLFAVLARCPVVGGKVASFDATRARAIAGVRHVIQLPETPLRASAVAVVADTTWAALEGRRALDIKWDEGSHRDLDSASIARILDEHATHEGVPDRNDGDVAHALATCAKTMTATYTVPFIPHQTMEPMNCTAHIRPDSCDVWGPFQFPDSVHEEAVKLTGLARSSITVHTTLVGGGFGRKAYIDFATEALLVAKAIGNTPVQLLWSREDDIQHDIFRPPSRHVLSAGFDATGRLLAWRHRIISHSLRGQWDAERKDEDIVRGLDKWATGPCNDVPYRAANFRTEFVMVPTAIRVGAWRSVYSSQTSLADECFVDELAAAFGKDPYQFRLELIGDGPSPHRAVLERAAKESGWGQPLPAGHFHGIAVHKANGSYVAEVAEVSVDSHSQVHVHRVTCAIDCGTVVNPAIVESQMEGGILFGLSAALHSEITFERGRCRQSNFHDAPVLRMADAPAIDVHIIDSARPPWPTRSRPRSAAASANCH